MQTREKKRLWRIILLSLIVSNLAAVAAASEITTPIIVNTAITYTSNDNVNISSLGASSSAISASSSNGRINLGGDINIQLQNLTTPTNLIYAYQSGGITLTGSQLNINAQSNTSISGIYVDASGISRSYLQNSPATNIQLSGSGTVQGIYYTGSYSTVPTLTDTSIKLTTADSNATVTGLSMSTGIINGNLNIDIKGGNQILGAGWDLTFNGPTNKITINSDVSRSITGIYGSQVTLKPGSSMDINILDNSSNSLSATGLYLSARRANEKLELGANSKLNINIQSQATGIDINNQLASGANGIIHYGFNAGAPTNTVASSAINITMNGQAVNNLGQAGTAGITAAYFLNINGPLNIDIQSAGGAGIRLTDTLIDNSFMAAGVVQLNGDTIIKTNQGYALISATYERLTDTAQSKVSINSSGGSLVQLTGNLDHKTRRESQFIINLDRADSFLTGSSLGSNKTNLPDVLFDECLTDIRLANGATWNMTGKDTINTTGNSVVNNLTFANQGYLNMTYSDTTSAYSYEQLTAHGWLGNNGKILMNTDLQTSFDTKDVAVASDRIVINKFIDDAATKPSPASQGTHTIDIKDASLLTKIASEGYLMLLTDQTQGAATFTGGNLIKGGIFKYKPIITSDNPTDYSNVPTAATNWYLTGFEKIGVTEETAINAGLAESRYIAYMNEQDTLIKRLGELRQNDKEQGIWVRIRGANNNIDGYGLTRNSYVSTHLGYDKRLQDQGTAKRYIGLAFNHTNNNFDYAANATGKGQSNALTIYGTRLGNKGHYLDLVGKLGRMSNDYKYQGQQVDGSNWFYSLSAEYGRSILRDKGWYYEPQVQFTWGHINGANYNSKESSVRADSINSAILRAGVLFGRKYNQDIPEKNGSYYAKLFYNHEFGGNVKASMTDIYGDKLEFGQNYSGSWITVGLGTSLNLNKKTNLYLDVEKAFGGKINGGWAWQGGMRWRF